MPATMFQHGLRLPADLKIVGLCIQGKSLGQGIFSAGIEPWQDVGNGLAGVSGVPTMQGSGDLTVGALATLDVSSAAASTSARSANFM